MSELELENKDSNLETSEPAVQSEKVFSKEEDEDEKGLRGKDAESKFPKKNPKYKKKVCKFTADKQLAASLNYKNVELLSRFITNRGKILPRRITGTSAKWQRILVREIKKARAAGLLPYKVM